MDGGSVAKYQDPDPESLSRCAELRALQVALVPVAAHDGFGDLEGWDDGTRYMLGVLASRNE